MNALQAEKFIDDIVAGRISKDAIKEVLKEMSYRGESVDEIVGVTKAMRKHVTPIPLPNGIELMDTCGTGGSGLPRMNISTTASFVLAAGGVKIAKHGNKSASSRSGSFDMLEKLGIKIDLSAEQVARAIQEVGIAFIFAQLFHPAKKFVAEARSELGIQTVFNFIGPLTNPAPIQYHLLGTTSPEHAEKIASVMKNLGYTRAMVVTGEDGLDDVTITGKTYVYDVNRGKVNSYEFQPEDVGIPRVPFEAIAGGSAEENAKMALSLLQGKATGALQNLLVVNCGFGFLVREMVESVNEGMELAYEILKSGDAYKKFIEYKEFTNQFA